MSGRSVVSTSQFWRHGVGEHVLVPEEDKLPYDEDPNNWTARLHPPGTFAQGALRPRREA